MTKLLHALLALWIATVFTSAQAQTVNPPVIPPGATLIPLNNTWSGTNTFSSTTTFNGTVNLAAMSITSVPCVAGSGTQSTGAITAGTKTLTITPAADFQNCQGIAVWGAGATMATSAPTITSAVQRGVTGSTSYKFYISWFDALGGYTAPSSVTVANGNATLTHANDILITMPSAPTGMVGYIVWVSINGGAAVYATAANTNTLSWTGYFQNWRPTWVPASNPSVAQNDWLVSNITAGAGSTTLTLADAAVTTVTSAPVLHDETAALNQLKTLYPNGVQARLGCGTYNITSAVVLSADNSGTPSAKWITLIGDGMCTNIQPFGAANYFEIKGSTLTALADGFVISNIYIPAYNSLGGEAVYSTFTTREWLVNVVIDHPFSGIEINKGNDFHWEHLRIYDRWGYGTFDWRMATGNGAPTIDALCCGYIIDVYSNNLATIQQVSGQNNNGMRSAGACWYITGNVATVFFYGDANSGCEGIAWFIANDVGNSSPPQFLQFIDSGAEYSNSRAIDIEAGQLFYFTHSNIHAANYTNHNVVIASGANFVQFNQGFNDTASANCFDISGSNINISDMVIYNCSWQNTQTYHGINISPSGNNVSITGNNFQGSWGGVLWQMGHPIFMNAGASKFSCGGNTFSGSQYDWEQNNAGYDSTRNCDGNAGRPPVAIASGFGTSPTISGTMLAFAVIIGTTPGNTGTINMPVANNGWFCQATNGNDTTSFTRALPSGTSQVILNNYDGTGTLKNFTAGHIIRVTCSYS